MNRFATLAALAVAAAAPGTAAPDGGAAERLNRFHDPFFAVTAEIAGCPEPLGPRMTEQEALSESHHRAERGTRCYLEKRCRHPSSYDYDREIAQRIQAASAAFAPHPSSLWVLVQGRRVFIYGCVDRRYHRGDLERALRAIPDVELAVEQVMAGARGAPPYRVK